MSPSSRSPRRRTWPDDRRSEPRSTTGIMRMAARYPDLDDRERTWEKTLALAFTQAQAADIRVAFDLPREKRSRLTGSRTGRADDHQ